MPTADTGADWLASLITKVFLLGWVSALIVVIPAEPDAALALPSLFCIGLALLLFGLHRVRNPKWRDLPAWQSRPIGRAVMGMGFGIFPGSRVMEWYIGGLQILIGLVFTAFGVGLMVTSFT
jgi:hypothetical protein